MSTRRLTATAALIGAGLLAGRLLGLVREALLAHSFGVSSAMDSLVVALSLPDSLGSLLAGPLVMALVPVLSEYASSARRDEFEGALSSLATWGASLGIAAAALAILASSFIVDLLAPGLSPAAKDMASFCVRIACVGLPFTTLLYVLLPALQSLNRFGVTAVSAPTFNLVLIVSILAVAPVVGIAGVAAGAALAFAGCVAVALISIRAAGYRLHLFRSWTLHPAVRSVIVVVGPALGACAVRDANLMIDRNFASGMGVGTIAALTYAERLIQMPLALGGTVTVAVFPLLARSLAARDWDTAARYLTTTTRYVLWVLVPVAVLMLVLAEPITVLLFQRGAFDAEAVARTASMLQFYTVGLPFQGLSAIFVIAFFSLRRPLPALWIAGVTVVSHLGLLFLLQPMLGYRALPLSTSLSYILQAYLLWRALSAEQKELSCFPNPAIEY